MSIYEAITMKSIWTFLSPLLSEKLKEKFKEKSSTEKAKERAFHLYETLGRVAELKAKLHVSIQGYLLTGIDYIQERKANPESIVVENKHKTFLYESTELNKSSRELAAALEDLSIALNAVNPQLEIHKKEFVDFLQMVTNDPFSLQQGIIDLIFRRSDIDAEEVDVRLRLLLNQLNEIQNMIQYAIEDFRTFLAGEFSFKESF